MLALMTAQLGDVLLRRKTPIIFCCVPVWCVTDLVMLVDRYMPDVDSRF